MKDNLATVLCKRVERLIFICIKRLKRSAICIYITGTDNVGCIFNVGVNEREKQRENKIKRTFQFSNQFAEFEFECNN